MKEILIFAGTTEGRKLSESLTVSGITHTLCVATEYGEIVLKENPFMTVHRGRMDKEKIREFIQNGKFEAVVDATHPYADIVTKNIKSAMEGMHIPYLRLKRELNDSRKKNNVTYFETVRRRHIAICRPLAHRRRRAVHQQPARQLDTECELSSGRLLQPRLHHRARQQHPRIWPHTRFRPTGSEQQDNGKPQPGIPKPPRHSHPPCKGGLFRGDPRRELQRTVVLAQQAALTPAERTTA